MVLQMKRPVSTTETSARAHGAHRACSSVIPRDDLQLTSTHTPHTLMHALRKRKLRATYVYTSATPQHTHVWHELQRSVPARDNRIFIFVYYYYFFFSFHISLSTDLLLFFI